MAEYIVKPTGPFRKDLKLAKKRGLLLYEKDTEIRIISLYRTGTHSDIFGKGKKK